MNEHVSVKYLKVEKLSTINQAIHERIHCKYCTYTAVYLRLSLIYNSKMSFAYNHCSDSTAQKRILLRHADFTMLPTIICCSISVTSIDKNKATHPFLLLQNAF